MEPIANSGQKHNLVTVLTSNVELHQISLILMNIDLQWSPSDFRSFLSILTLNVESLLISLIFIDVDLQCEASGILKIIFLVLTSNLEPIKSVDLQCEAD